MGCDFQYCMKNQKGTWRAQTSIKSNPSSSYRVDFSILFKSAIEIHFMSGCNYNGFSAFLHWVCFVTIVLYCHLLDFKIYGIVKHMLWPSSLASVSKTKTKLMHQFCDSYPL